MKVLREYFGYFKRFRGNLVMLNLLGAFQTFLRLWGYFFSFWRISGIFISFWRFESIMIILVVREYLTLLKVLRSIQSISITLELSRLFGSFWKF